MIEELVIVRDGVCCLISAEFASDDVCALISYLLQWLSDFSLIFKYFIYIIFFNFLSVYCAFLSRMYTTYVLL